MKRLGAEAPPSLSDVAERIYFEAEFVWFLRLKVFTMLGLKAAQGQSLLWTLPSELSRIDEHSEEIFQFSFLQKKFKIQNHFPN